VRATVAFVNLQLREWIRQQMDVDATAMTYRSVRARTAGEPYLQIEQEITAQHIEQWKLETMTDGQMRALGARFTDRKGYLEEWRA
jgi:hypothetical protein